MANACSTHVRVLANRIGGALFMASLVITAAWILTGCASIPREMPAFHEAWDPGVEVRFPGALPCNEEGDAAGGSGAGEVETRVVTAPEVPMPPGHRLVRGVAAVTLSAIDQLGLTVLPRRLRGIPDYGDTKYTLIPGTYAFEYEKSGFSPVFGEVSLYPVVTPRARDYIRHGSIALTPGMMGGKSVLTEADLDRSRSGDVVTKVVFMAHMPAIRDRLDDIDRGLRELARLRATLEEQKGYWNRKLTERRLNTRYSSEFGWGVDVPSFDLAILQTLVGPERYHWHRFSEAEDKVRTYEDKIARLDLPERRLQEERDALEQLLNSAEVIHRTTDLTVLTAAMIRPHRDPVDEVHRLRGTDVWADAYRGKIMHDVDDWVGPWGKVHFPYWYSSLSMAGLMPGLRPVAAPSHALTKNIGEVLLVLQIGPRQPIELGGHSWVGEP